jgi:hypothetical protein
MGGRGGLGDFNFVAPEKKKKKNCWELQKIAPRTVERRRKKEREYTEKHHGTVWLAIWETARQTKKNERDTGGKGGERCGDKVR